MFCVCKAKRTNMNPSLNLSLLDRCMELQLKQPNPSNELAFVLGNGTSRLKLNHSALKSIGTVFGCNALYREFDPDYLIAVDVKMVNEIVMANYHIAHSVWTNPNKGINTKKGLNFFNPHKGWSSGPTALNFAADRGHRDIYIFGFDYQGTNGKLNNIYADTYNYKKSSDSATYHGNWLNQTEKIIRERKNITFHRVIPLQGLIPDKLAVIKNLKHLTYDEFEKFYPGSIYIHQNDQKTTI